MARNSKLQLTEEEVTKDVIDTLAKVYKELNKKYKKHPQIKYCLAAMVKYHCWFVNMLNDKIKLFAN